MSQGKGNNKTFGDFDKAMRILEELRNTIEVAMIDDEYARFGEALILLKKTRSGV